MTSQLRNIIAFISYAIKRKKSKHNYFQFQQFQSQLVINILKKYINLNQPQIILDVGSRYGGYVYPLLQIKKHEIISLDKYPSSFAIEQYKKLTTPGKHSAIKRVLKEKTALLLNTKEIAALQGDITCTPFNDNSFDLILASSIIEHVKDQQQMIDECYRILKPEGILYLSFPPYYSPVGGHYLSPFHYLPQNISFWIFKKLHPNKEKPYDLCPTTISSIFKMVKVKFIIRTMRPRVFEFLTPLLYIPLLREVICHHIEFILEKKR